ncbi:MAG TPA: hypothetical protein VNK48_10730, partial [Xanthobacteraceae bacterium]|nr:hypothetical protein [Xanthobacteraceae bacterium]
RNSWHLSQHNGWTTQSNLSAARNDRRPPVGNQNNPQSSEFFSSLLEADAMISPEPDDDPDRMME